MRPETWYYNAFWCPICKRKIIITKKTVKEAVMAHAKYHFREKYRGRKAPYGALGEIFCRIWTGMRLIHIDRHRNKRRAS